MSLTQINKAGLDEIALDHVFTVGASGTDHYTFQGEGLNGTVNDPTLYLTRGKTYRFEKGSAHPLRIQSTQGASGTAYNTGVTNNGGTGTVIIEVQHDAPDVLYYQCTSHAAMNGVLYITGALADGGVTTAKLADNAVTTAKIAAGNVTESELANDAVTNAKIADNAIQNNQLANGEITAAKLASNSVTSAKIANEAVQLEHLPHGTSSNDGKFLRANNGADPTFETVTSTTINNNADNRVITGSGTANTLNGESNLTYNGTRLEVKTGDLAVTGGEGGDAQLRLTADEGDDGADYWRLESKAYNNNFNLATYASGSWADKVTVDSSGRVGLGHNLSGATDYNRLVVHNPLSGSSWMQLTSTATGNGINTDGLAIGLNTANNGHIWLRENADLAFATNGTKRMSILAGGGLAFNSDTAQANALDDYEEGTFTPNIQDAASGGNSVSSGTRQGKYVKVGSHITVMIHCSSLSNSGMNGSHQMFITNLPFRMSGVGQIGVFTQLRFFNNVSNTQFGTHFQINNNETIMRLGKLADNAGDTVPITFNHWMYSSGYFAFHCSFSYFTDQ